MWTTLLDISVHSTLTEEEEEEMKQNNVEQSEV